VVNNRINVTISSTGSVTGATGPQGATGIGLQGATGSQGNKGGLLYKFGFSPSGYMSFNDTDITLVTQITFDSITFDGGSVGQYINSWQDGGTLVIQSNTNGDSTYGIFSVTSVTVNPVFPGFEYLVDVNYVDGTLPSTGEICVVSFSKIGNTGPAGSLGYSMWFGNISQTGTNNPVATELGSTLGYALSWTRGATGSYYAEAIGAPAGFLSIGIWCTTPSESVKNSNLSLRQKVIIKEDSSDPFGNRLVLTTMNDSGVFADDLLLNQPVEIRKVVPV
jgi:hypothetical protein